MSKFKELGLRQDFVDALEKVGYTEPTPIQEEAIPELLKGSDVIGQAQTGTGKTAAFGLPMLQSIDPDRREVQGLVLTPTRELCIQVAQSLRAYGQVAGLDVLATFGGAPIRQQMDRLRHGPHVVVGTVGRVLDLHSRHSLMFHDARFVVLDEADEMLDLGFLEDVDLILGKCPRGRQTALFSATMPQAITKLAESHLIDPVTIRVKAPTLTIDTVEHRQFATTRKDKVDDIIKILETERPTQAIIFARTKIGVDRLARDLDRRKPGLRVRALHGDMSQGSRDGVMIAFKDNRVPVLVATDIAARGLDVQNVTHVINYDLPNSAEIYTHRIGRTGRAGRGGRAITLVEPRDRDDFRAIERHINVTIPQWTPDGATPVKPAKSEQSGSDDSASDGERKQRERRPRQRRGETTEDAAATASDEAAKAESDAKDEPEAKAESDAKPEKSETDVKAEADAEPEAEAKTEPEKKPEAETEAEPVGDGVETKQPDSSTGGFTWGDPVGDSATAEKPEKTEKPTEAEAEAPQEAEETPQEAAEPVTQAEDESSDATAQEPAERATSGTGMIPDRSATEQPKQEFSWGPAPGGAKDEKAEKTEQAEEKDTAEQPSSTSSTTDAKDEKKDDKSGRRPRERSGRKSEPKAESKSDSSQPDSKDESKSDREPGELRRPRHLKPDQSELHGGFSLLIVSGGTRQGFEPADVIELVTSKSNLTGSDVRRVRVLSRFTLLQVPSDRAADVAGSIAGSELHGQTIAADAVVDSAQQG